MAASNMYPQLVYCCRIPKGSRGVRNKIENTVKALNDLDYSAQSLIVEKGGGRGHLALALALFTLNCRIVLLRATPFTMWLMLPGLLYLRLKGTKLIIDVPTPFQTVVEEVKGEDSLKVVKAIKILLMYVFLPVTMLPAHRVLQYSHDSTWFSFGLNHKTHLIGNGIDLEKIPFRSSKPELTKRINFTGVALIAFWHGYDRLIDAIATYNKETVDGFRVHFNIVGEGEERRKLEQQVRDLGVEDSVTFHGYKAGEELDRVFNDTHIGVCSLALYRKRLETASELKAREYAARGIPFVLGCSDFDFDQSLAFVKTIENSDDNIDLSEIVSWYTSLDRENEDFSFIREFASAVDFRVKVQKDLLSLDESWSSKRL